jgi:regulator of replication initiation timing
MIANGVIGSIDLTNLIRGEGEWKNMQEIIRRTFKQCFDTIEKQSEQIVHLVGQVASLKKHMSKEVMSRGEIESMVEIKVEKMIPTSKRYIQRHEYDGLVERVINMRSDLERKASMRYVDDNLRSKMDKSDALVKNISILSNSKYASQLTSIFSDLSETKMTVESLVKMTTDLSKDVNDHVVDRNNFHIAKNQIDTIYRSLSTDYCTKNHLQLLLDQKQDISGLQSELSTKADSHRLDAFSHRVESILESHEKSITQLRLRGGGGGGG